MSTSTLTKSQVKTYGPKIYTENRQKYKLTVTVRYDDQCGNGRNSFSITASQDRAEHGRWVDDCGGCCHDLIAKHFPKLQPLIKWHSMTSQGPWGYIANTTFFAGDRDCWGLRKGEGRQIRKGGKEPCWILKAIDAQGNEHDLHTLEKYADGERPSVSYRVEFRPWMRYGEGKARELDLARSSAVWPDATDEDLTAPGLEARLAARLPQLLQDFQRDVEVLGFTF